VPSRIPGHGAIVNEFAEIILTIHRCFSAVDEPKSCPKNKDFQSFVDLFHEPIQRRLQPQSPRRIADNAPKSIRNKDERIPRPVRLSARRQT